jgi:hypothetical protein
MAPAGLSHFRGNVAILPDDMATSAETVIVVLAGITVVWALISVVVLRRARHRHDEVAVLRARPRRVRVQEESGSFVPLAEVGAALVEPAVKPEPEPEPEPEPQPEPLEAAAAPVPVDAATTYEIVWYRDEERIAFALQPVDGRAAPWARYRSASFAWPEDCDPPASLRAAQRAHGRLRARLDRDGWRHAGRGASWFNHRVGPPAAPPRRRAHDDD